MLKLPRDKIWGIGIGSKNPNTQNKNEWKGTNILGWALMEARESLNKKDNFEDKNIQMELQKYKEDI